MATENSEKKMCDSMSRDACCYDTESFFACDCEYYILSECKMPATNNKVKKEKRRPKGGGVKDYYRGY
jgi:hypothetical protein